MSGKSDNAECDHPLTHLWGWSSPNLTLLLGCTGAGYRRFSWKKTTLVLGFTAAGPGQFPLAILTLGLNKGPSYPILFPAGRPLTGLRRLLLVPGLAPTDPSFTIPVPCSPCVRNMVRYHRHTYRYLGLGGDIASNDLPFCSHCYSAARNQLVTACDQLAPPSLPPPPLPDSPNSR